MRVRDPLRITRVLSQVASRVAIPVRLRARHSAVSALWSREQSTPPLKETSLGCCQTAHFVRGEQIALLSCLQLVSSSVNSFSSPFLLSLSHSLAPPSVSVSLSPSLSSHRLIIQSLFFPCYTGAVTTKFIKLTATVTRFTLTLRLVVGRHLKWQLPQLPPPLGLQGKWLNRDRGEAKTVPSCEIKDETCYKWCILFCSFIMIQNVVYALIIKIIHYYTIQHGSIVSDKKCAKYYSELWYRCPHL